MDIIDKYEGVVIFTGELLSKGFVDNYNPQYFDLHCEHGRLTITGREFETIARIFMERYGYRLVEPSK